MTGAAQFIGDVPGNYDKCLGPILFEGYADDITARAAKLKPNDLLELAAGTGIVSRRLVDALPSARITVTDLNPPMLELAQKRLAGAKNATLAPADAGALGFGDEAFDVIVCQFGVMFFPDKVGAFREARRVLKKGGTYLFNVWAPWSANPFAQIAWDVCTRFYPDNTPGFYRVPFSYGDVAAVRADLAAAGFTDVAHDVVKFDRKVPDWTHFAQGVVYGNPLSAEIEARGGKADDVKAAVIEALQARFGPSPSSMPLEAIVFTVRK